MHNSYIRPGGVWNTLTGWLSTEAAAFDAAQFKAINGDDGGTWAPAARIIIGGLGLELASTTSGYHRVNGTGELRWESGTTLRGVIGSTMNWQGSASFTLAPTFGNGFNANGTAQCNAGLEVTSAVPSDINVGVGGVITLVGSNPTYSTMTVGTYGKIDMVGTGILQAGSSCYWYTSGEIVCEGNITFDPSTGKVMYLGSTNADMRLDGALKTTAGGAGRITKRVKAATDADYTIRADQYDVYVIANGVLTSARTLTLSTTGAIEGDVIQVTCEETTYGVGIYPAGVYDVTAKSASTFYRYVTYIYTGGAWRKLDGYVVP